MKSRMLRISFLIGLALVTAQCSVEPPLQLFIPKSTTSVFYGTSTEVCGATLPDEEEITGPGMKVCNPCIIWKQSEILQLTNIKVEFPKSDNFPNGAFCTIDSDALEELFPDETRLVDGVATKDGKLYGKSGPNGYEHQSCATGFACTGLTAANNKANFLATGTATINGVGQETGRAFHGTSKITLYYYPE
ncbi:MAG: hypothetical protein AB7F59_07070 [Bdellovibrionales bacterium]